MASSGGGWPKGSEGGGGGRTQKDHQNKDGAKLLTNLLFWSLIMSGLAVAIFLPNHLSPISFQIRLLSLIVVAIPAYFLIKRLLNEFLY